MNITAFVRLFLRSDIEQASITVRRQPSMVERKKYIKPIPSIPPTTPISNVVAPDMLSINKAIAIMYSKGLTDAKVNARKAPPFLSSLTRLFTVSMGDEPTNIGVSVDTIMNFSLSSPESENIIAING